MSPGQALYLLERLRTKVAARVRNALGLRRTVYVNERVAEYRGYWEAGARLHGAEFHSMTGEVWEAALGQYTARLTNHLTPCDDPATLRLAGDKPYCYRLAIEAGIPVPEHIVLEADAFEAAREFVETRVGPFVVKPARGSSSGLGVSTVLEGWPQVVRALALASLYDPRVILERMVAGESCRLLYLDGKMIHAVRRRGVRIVGDGHHTVADLLMASGHRSLVRERNTLITLRAQGLAPESVPRQGEELVTRSLPAEERSKRELRTVYNETITDQCGAELVAGLGRIVRALGTEFAGVDAITFDPRRPLLETGGTFLEINTTPGIHHHYITPEDFAPNPVARQVLTHLLDGARPEER
jgi:cyanophycin synthetase